MSLFALFYMLLSYLLGSVSSAILLCRLVGLPDPRTSGSNNPGATNVLRIGGRWVALAVLLCDMLKGTLPVWFGYYLGLTQFELGMVALGACLGHIFPIFFKFKGGKGVATAFGAIAPIACGFLDQRLLCSQRRRHCLVSAALCLVVQTRIHFPRRFSLLPAHLPPP